MGAGGEEGEGGRAQNSTEARYDRVRGEFTFMLQPVCEINRDSVVANYIDRAMRARAMALWRVEMA